MTQVEQVQQAFLHLCWAIKLSSYLRDCPPDNKVYFDKPLPCADPSGTFDLPGNQFDTINDILLGAENSILISVGAFFIALDTALEQAGFKHRKPPQNSFGELRTLIYLCRCAYAHNVLAPQWDVRQEYRRKLAIKLPGITLDIDLTQLAGVQFDIKQIGGYSELFKIKDYIIKELASIQEKKAARGKDVAENKGYA